MRIIHTMWLFAIILPALQSPHAAAQPSTTEAGEVSRQVANARKAIMLKDWPQALQILRPLADAGNAKAQTYLGLRYLKGEGVPQDNLEALMWFQKAAAQGLAWGQHYIGWMYFYGEGVEQDEVEALKWFRKAAAQDYSESQYLIGWAYAHGKGVPRDDREAATWYRKAAEQENADAEFELGTMYVSGTGVDRDLIEGYKWLAVSVAHMNEGARPSLDDLRKQLSKAQLDQAEERAEDYLFPPSPDGTCGGTTLDTVICLSRKQKKADAELNDVYQQALKAAQGITPGDVENLREAQRQWISYRDAACKAEYGLWRGGSGGPAARIACEIRLTELRITDMKDTYFRKK